MNGTVHLVGAGPGDPGLLTIRAQELLAVADVVVYDRLGASGLLHLANPAAELIDAGKVAGDHTLPQDATNALLIRRALAGEIVVRLKGGDPLVFGRGGEEAAECRKHGIPFVFVPGVTSAFAVPAYAGIPVTHRGVAQHVTVVTASAGVDGAGDPEYGWLARSDGTIVLLMGLRRVGHVAAQLVEHGAPADRPIAVVSRGTGPDQRTVVGTLATIGELVDAARLTSPAIIVVGDVVDLREQLEWFERQPLFGTRIVVTRARPQASDLVRTLASLGADVIECPTIALETLPTDDLDARLRELSNIAMLVLTSRNAAEIVFARLAALGLDSRAFGSTLIAVVGPGTAQILEAHGIVPDVVPALGQRTSAGLVHALADQPLYRANVLVVRAEQGDDALIEGLASYGAKVHVEPVYRTVMEIPDAAVVLRAVQADLVTFTSASTVRNFAELLPPGVPRPPAISIGPRTTEQATAEAFDVVAESGDPSIASLAAAIVGYVHDGRSTAAAASGRSDVDEEPA